MATEDAREQGRCASWSASSLKRGGRGVRCRLSRLHSGPCRFDDQIEEALVIPRLVDRAELEAAEATAEKLREELAEAKRINEFNIGVANAELRETGSLTRRALAAESRATALGDALRGMIRVTELPGTRSEIAPDMERARSIARRALSDSDSNTEGQ